MRREHPSDDELRRDNPRRRANCCSYLTFWYTLGIFRFGNHHEFKERDLTKPLPGHKSAILGRKIACLWSEEVERAREEEDTPSLIWVLFRYFHWDFILYGIILMIMEIVLRINQPLFVGLLIRYFSPGNQRNKEPIHPPMYFARLFSFWSPGQSPIQREEAFLFAGGVIFCSAIVVVLFHPFALALMHIGMKIRVACCSLIYRKALRISLESLGGKTVGNVVNLLSNDVNRFDMAPTFFHYMWIGPAQILCILYFLYKEMKLSAIIGILTVVAVIPFQASLGFATAKLRRKTAARTDERVRQMNEIVQGVQVIKMYAWEYAFTKLISTARRREIKVLKRTSYIRGVIMSFIMFTTRVAVFLTVLCYVLLEDDITAEKVFVITSYYQILRQTMTVFFPQAVVNVAEALVAIKRIQTFLQTPETDIGDPTPIDPHWMFNARKFKLNNHQLQSMKSSLQKYVQIDQAFAKFGDVICLHDIRLNIVAGRLVVIIGAVGSGKSSILNMILGELRPYRGSIRTNGVVSYACQEPWLFAGSVRQNILFGQEYDRTRYKEVVRACALVRDFVLLPYGDKTIVGERGISLSGGQRARVNLARAIYKEADIYLLDDPLSAVDTQVGKQLFEECITGYLEDKVVVLVTHQLQYLKNVEQIVIMDEGMIIDEGSYHDMLSSGVNFAKLFETIEADVENEPMDKVHHILRHISIHSKSSVVSEKGFQDPIEVPEMRTEGAIGGDVYKEYFKAGGNCCQIFCVVLLFLFAQMLGSSCDVFITQWVRLEEHISFNETKAGILEGLARDKCITIYSVLVFLVIVVALTRSFVFYNTCMTASVTLHDRMFYSICTATMRFFNTNTSGRILNRFSKDLGAIDEFLPNAMIDCFQIFLNLFGVIVVVSVVSVYLLIPTVIICIVFYFIRRYYVSTSRSVKRLEGITRSPVFAHMNASLQGLTTIRSHGQEMVLVDEFDRFQDVHSSSWYFFIAISRAFGYWLDLVCVLYITIITCYFFIDDDVFGGDVGLAITQCIGLTGLFQWGMRQSAELENQMTSVERVLEFTTVEHEAALESKAIYKPSYKWPTNGKVEFVNAYMRYNIAETPVLKDLTFLIAPREKVGIVGRTGAGKSSLISALFRLAYFEGKILIDDVDISFLGLHDLRKKISIIPQEPVIFSGTMRYNLDPFNEYKDDAMVAALVAVEIRIAITQGKSSLNYVMAEGGTNMSVGERQLICLARAILRNNIILIMDEATANVDPQTDQFIQRTIRTKFAHCTVLTIAHRLNTVMDYDKILVMDAGKVVEYDRPFLLLQDKAGFLSQMVAKMGATMTERLHQVAKSAYERQDEDNQDGQTGESSTTS